jgi:hypothetical protein
MAGAHLGRLGGSHSRVQWQGGLVAGDAEASAVQAMDLLIGRDKIVRANPLGSVHGHEGNVLEGATVPTPGVRPLLPLGGWFWAGAGRAAADQRGPQSGSCRRGHPAARQLRGLARRRSLS